MLYHELLKCVLSCLVLSCLVLSCLVLSCLCVVCYLLPRFRTAKGVNGLQGIKGVLLQSGSAGDVNEFLCANEILD
jgi:hypothetical protein